MRTVSIPSSVTSIGDCAFYGCSGLTSVFIPSSVTSIRKWSFYGCPKLTAVQMPRAANYDKGILPSFGSTCRVTLY